MSNPLKKTMVYLGLADEEEVYDEPAPQVNGRKPQAIEKAAPVTPLHRPTVVRQVAPAAISEILTVHPKQYRDAQVIAENFRDGIPVIINLSQMSDADARRLIDFASGLCYGLNGSMEKVAQGVYLLTPAGVSVSAEDRQPRPEGGS